ncbi:MAG: helix-turn-helix domain-containing protein [Lachnospiraceae bacterium]|nr:helix-turn-helix domain-containing protein [Lachnospiraceae bacterium]
MRIGEVLEKERNNRGLMKNEVCKGLCSPSTYGRYENNQIEPNKFMVDALLERLGKNPEKISYMASADEIDCVTIRLKIEKKLREQNADEVGQLLNQYKKLSIVHGNKLHLQYILRTEALILLFSNKKTEAINKLEEALLLTKELDFMSDNSPVFTIMEMEIILCLCSNKFFDEDLLFEIYYYITRLGDKNILKLRFYDKAALEIVKNKKGVENRKLLLMLEDVLTYKRRIFQYIGVSEILLSKKLLGEILSSDEEKLLEVGRMIDI